ncbi:hypothetical protein halTADL_2232 [Halohasta litchfieldiae]|jgi:hypothetical protein|uniref:Uncharacterized protein n=1 Tax=Halohasta litchfieldiae TaxID=1073996 RepID=A0A1H6VAZ3_9EURY|nr:hypothetical protein [Halohasta litchfieldiae]ATW88979.1 hypothetical protein halTADL_2232 [Halohasta litchfieldiae]SEJ01743.1 hypothetical protein SAMN05444271_11651 [Halohasta litchfieldiae]
MDTAARARAETREVVADIEPQHLRQVLYDRLADSSMAPGVLVFLSAQASDPEVDLDSLAERSAGVQLIYEGLRLTRSIAHAEPWTDTETDEIDADIDILAADVFVSRGFYLLAQTEASAAAVTTVQSFGRDQTLRGRPDADVDTLDRNLEADIFALAVRAGLTAVDTNPSEAVLSFAADLARADGEELSAAGIVLSELTVSRLTELSNGVDGAVPSSASEG